MADELSTEKLARLIARKRELLEEIRQSSIQQIQLVSDAENNSLIGILSRKQNLLESLETVQTELVPYRHQDPEKRAWQDQHARAACQANVERCQALIDELLAIEDQSISEMTRRRDAVACQLSEHQNAYAARAAYQYQVHEMLSDSEGFDGAS